MVRRCLPRCSGALHAHAPSAPARRLDRQLQTGREHFEAGRWREAVSALDLRKPAALLRTDAERRRFWPRLHEAAAHRAQSQLRAADLAGTVEERRRGLAQAVRLFETALAMDDNAYRFLDFVYDACRAYWRLERVEPADALFEAAREVDAPLTTPRQMPCCSASRGCPSQMKDRGTPCTSTASLAHSETTRRHSTSS